MSSLAQNVSTMIAMTQKGANRLHVATVDGFTELINRYVIKEEDTISERAKNLNGIKKEPPT